MTVIKILLFLLPITNAYLSNCALTDMNLEICQEQKSEIMKNYDQCTLVKNDLQKKIEELEKLSTTTEQAPEISSLWPTMRTAHFTENPIKTTSTSAPIKNEPLIQESKTNLKNSQIQCFSDELLFSPELIFLAIATNPVSFLVIISPMVVIVLLVFKIINLKMHLNMAQKPQEEMIELKTFKVYPTLEERIAKNEAFEKCHQSIDLTESGSYFTFCVRNRTCTCIMC